MTVSGSAPQRFLFVVIILAIAVFGCAGGGDIKEQISGKWKKAEGGEVVEIQLADGPKSLVVDGKMFDAVVEKIDMDRYSVEVKVHNGDGKSEVWTLRQIWDDNGTRFKLAFSHGGTEEILISS